MAVPIINEAAGEISPEIIIAITMIIKIILGITNLGLLNAFPHPLYSENIHLL